MVGPRYGDRGCCKLSHIGSNNVNKLICVKRSPSNEALCLWLPNFAWDNTIRAVPSSNRGSKGSKGSYEKVLVESIRSCTRV